MVKCSYTTCNKKLGIVQIAIKCKCKKSFCTNHIFSNNHNCDYDYRIEGLILLKKSNPIIIANKFERIDGIDPMDES
jgi:hypothetical protein